MIEKRGETKVVEFWRYRDKNTIDVDLGHKNS